MSMSDSETVGPRDPSTSHLTCRELAGSKTLCDVSDLLHSNTFPRARSAAPSLSSSSYGEDSTPQLRYHVRKPSEAGLHLQTDVPSIPTSSAPAAPGPLNDTGDSSNIKTRSRQRSNASNSSLQRFQFESRRSLESSNGSPGSSVSSPALAALNDVTPLPSPIVPTSSPELWKRVAGRPKSSSSASIEREKAGAFLSPKSSSPQRKKKPYGHLSTSPPALSVGTQNQASFDQNRTVSEFVPDPLQNVRPRTVTGPGAITPPSKLNQQNIPPPSAVSPLHREEFRGSKDFSSVVDQQRLNEVVKGLPTPPASHSGTSDDGERKRSITSPTTGSEVLTVTDQRTKQTHYYRSLRLLGNGAFSEVFLATKENSLPCDGVKAEDKSNLNNSNMNQSNPVFNEMLVAVKIVSHHSASDEERMDTSIKREIDILQQISHPCLPELYTFEDNESRALLVLNYCPGGDLFELASLKRELLTPPLIRRVFSETTRAVTYLHSKGICHRDIKLENVLFNIPHSHLTHLLSSSSPLQEYPYPLTTLTDLGLAKIIPKPPESPLLTHPCGSIDYAAPEILLGQPYDGRSTDAWALGVLLYALMEGRLPFDPLPDFITGSINTSDGSSSTESGAGARQRRRRRGRGTGTNVKHRIARCDWVWGEFGDEEGDWILSEDCSDTIPQNSSCAATATPAPAASKNGIATATATTLEKAKQLEGARNVVEGLLKKAARGRWDVERVLESEFVRDYSGFVVR